MARTSKGVDEMNDKSLVVRPTDLLTSDITPLIHETARKLMKLVPGYGRKLNSEQSAELAVYAVINQLNPFDGECYYGDNGPMPGIQGYRRKAQEQLYAEAPNGHAPRMWCDYEVAIPGRDGIFNPDAGDVGWVAVLHDSIAQRQWQESYYHAFAFFKGQGLDTAEAKAMAADLAGKEPVWTAAGVVYANEKFGKEGAPEKWDRNERAKKRAESRSIRKRFTGIRIIDVDLGETWDAGVNIRELASTIQAEEDLPQPKLGAAQAMADLGFDPEPAKSEPERPWTPEYLRQWVANKSTRFATKSVSEQERNVLASCMNNTFQGVEIDRHAFCKWISGDPSTKTMRAEYALALLDWLDVRKFDDLPDPLSLQEAQAALASILKASGQQSMGI
jgi:hypothetical protein